jgi:phage gpG-like protein
MATPAVQIDGLRELRSAVRKAQDVEIKAAVKDANVTLAKRVVAKALPNVPVRTGRLRASVRALGNQSGALGKAGGASVPYAAAIHWGWRARHIRPRPFLTDAADSLEQAAVDEYADALETIVRHLSAH